MKIYFCGSIKGGRQKVNTYKYIIDLLKKYGEVLTEHVGDSNYALTGYALAEAVYVQDTLWLNQCDVVVADVSVASIGVGYELGMAEALGKKIFCLYDEGFSETISSMIKGNKNFTLYSYTNEDDLKEIICNKIF